MKNPFRLPSPAEAAADELAHAELSLLKAHTVAEQAAADLSFHNMRVARLRALVAAHKAADDSAPNIVKLPVMDPANFRRPL